MSDSEFTLSIITPNYNDGKLLAERLNQLLPLMPSDVEYLICDDASTDDSVKLITEAIADHPNVRFFQNDQNLGVIETCNKITPLARGKYLYFSSANDFVDFGIFLKVLPFLQEGMFGVLVTDILFRAKQSDQEDCLQILLKEHKQPVLIPPEDVATYFQTTFLWIPSTSAFLRRDLVEKHGYYSKKIRHLTDFYLNHVVAVDGGVFYLPNHLFAHYLVENDSYCNKSAATGKIRLGIDVLQMIDSLNPILRQRIYQAGIFAPVFKPLLGYLLLRPKHWKLVFYMVKRKAHLSKVSSLPKAIFSK